MSKSAAANILENVKYLSAGTEEQQADFVAFFLNASQVEQMAIWAALQHCTTFLFAVHERTVDATIKMAQAVPDHRKDKEAWDAYMAKVDDASDRLGLKRGNREQQ